MTRKRDSTVHERSAGAVVFHDAPEGPREYLLLRYGSGHWGFPKGHVEHGETDETAARREVAEETSIPPEAQRFIHGFVEPTRYTFRRGRVRVEKEVLFFLIQALTRDVKVSAEHTTFTWLPFHAALARLTFDGSQRALRRAEAHLAGATANT
jgi:bis(5'-nucleosidyl)-tetraphosphatase